MNSSFQLIKSHQQPTGLAMALLQKCHLRLLNNPDRLSYSFSRKELEFSSFGKVSAQRIEQLASELLGLQLSGQYEGAEHTKTSNWPLFEKITFSQNEHTSQLAVSFNPQVVKLFQQLGSKKLYIAT